MEPDTLRLKTLALVAVLLLQLGLYARMVAADSGSPPFVDVYLTQIGLDDHSLLPFGGNQGGGVSILRVPQGETQTVVHGWCWYPEAQTLDSDGSLTIKALLGFEYLWGDYGWPDMPLTVTWWPQEITFTHPGECVLFAIQITARLDLRSSAGWWIVTDWRANVPPP